MLLSETPLDNNEIFEIAIQETAFEWSGCLKIGVISNESGNWLKPTNRVPDITSIPANAWYLTGKYRICNLNYPNKLLFLMNKASNRFNTYIIDCKYLGNEVRHSGCVLCPNYCPSLEWLCVGDKIGLKRTHDGNLKFYINGEDMGIAASNVPEMVHAIIELFGSTVAINITSSKHQNTAISPNASLRLQDSLELLLDPMPPVIKK